MPASFLAKSPPSQSHLFILQVCGQKFRNPLISGKQCFFHIMRFPYICSFLPLKQKTKNFPSNADHLVVMTLPYKLKRRWPPLCKPSLDLWRRRKPRTC